MKKILKVLLVLIFAALIIICAMYAVFFAITADAELDENKLTNYSQCISVCDSDGKEITNTALISKRKSVQLENLNQYTIDAFIASEDRAFFNHNGLNHKRMAKALYENITSHSFKEGASTISQQLIKNTHLTGEKTLKRKLSEIKLAKKLEKKYTKEQILQMYLNTIYFGHNCYGLESASEFYFGKTASNLTLEQSATMVGLLTSPNNLSPFKNPDKCLARRNIVLDCMLECGYIDKKICEEAKKADLSAEKRQSENTNDYLNAVFEELEDLNLDYYSLSEGCKIVTCLDRTLQKYIEDLNYTTDNSIIIISNTGKVKAYKSTINGAKRQPGSTVKPLFIYAPAIEEKQINPSSKILDEKINYGGYSPENYDKKYHGYVTVAESLKYSYNIPAVKILNALTIEKAEKYANMSGIALDNEEKNLSLALGGMKYGLTLKEICDRYTVFANKGYYKPSHFIDEIILKNGKTIYKAKETTEKIYSEGTCSLINDMLIGTSKEGTAKKLKNFNFDIASKTGTCGNTYGNTDAYCISYTSADTIGIWLGDKDNKPQKITGGNDSAKFMEDIINKIYNNITPLPLDTTSGTENVKIDREEYNNNNKILLADSVAPDLTIKEIKVLKGNAPKLKSDRFSYPIIEKPTICIENNSVFIQLCQTYYYSYLINREKNGQTMQIYDGDWTEEIIDTPDDGCYVYSVTPYYSNAGKIFYGKTIKLPAINIGSKITTPSNPQKNLPDIVHREWYNE